MRMGIRKLIRLINGQLENASIMADYGTKNIEVALVSLEGRRAYGLAVEMESSGERDIRYPLGSFGFLSKWGRERVLARLKTYYSSRKMDVRVVGESEILLAT